jgi:hypothetical protein
MKKQISNPLFLASCISALLTLYGAVFQNDFLFYCGFIMLCLISFGFALINFYLIKEN